MRFLNALKSDMLFQFKHGFYVIYAVLTLFYVLLLTYLPHKFSDMVAPLIILSDPSLLGFFFIGGILMLEKTQGILDSLLVTPLHVFEYLLAKITSLTFIALFSSLIIAYGSGLSFHPIALILSILLISSFFTLLGFMVALQCETINQYFIKMIPPIILLIVPCLLLFVVRDLWILKLIPSVASVYLILGAFNGISLWEFLLYGTGLVIFIVLCFTYVNRYLFKILYGGK